jgi:uncharacterized repeat protein (TIGR03803 family)
MRSLVVIGWLCLLLMAGSTQSSAQSLPPQLYDNPPVTTCWLQASDGILYAEGYVFNMTTLGPPTAFPLPSCNFFQGTDTNFYSWTSNEITQITLAGATSRIHTLSTTDGSDVAAIIEGNDGNYYGVASSGGANGYGTLFTFTSSGSFTKLYDFTNGADGEGPSTLIQASDGNLYGVGSSFFRAVFLLACGSQ